MREDYIYYNIALHLNKMILQVEQNSGVDFPLEKFLPQTDWHHDVGAYKFNTMVKYFVNQGLLAEGVIPELNLDSDWNFSLTRHYISMFLDNVDFENIGTEKMLALLNGEGQYWGFDTSLPVAAGESLLLKFQTTSELLDKYFLDGRAEGSGMYLVINGSGGWDWSSEIEGVFLDGNLLQKYSIFTENDNLSHELRIVFNTDVLVPAIGVSQWNSNWFSGSFESVVKEGLNGSVVYSNTLMSKTQGKTQNPEIGTPKLVMEEYSHEVWGYTFLDFGYKVDILEGTGGYGSSEIWTITAGTNPSGNLATDGIRFVAEEGDVFQKFSLASALSSTELADGKVSIAQMGLYKVDDGLSKLVFQKEFRGSAIEGSQWNEVQVTPFQLEAGVEYFLGLSVNGWTSWPEFSPESSISKVYDIGESEELSDLDGLSVRSSNWVIPFYATIERKLNTEGS